MDYLKQYARMCAANNCADCPFGARRGETCQDYVLGNIEEAKKIIAEWAEKHPEKTRKQDFLEKFPNANLTTNGIPKICCKYLGYEEICKSGCEQCWNKPV